MGYRVWVVGLPEADFLKQLLSFLIVPDLVIYLKPDTKHTLEKNTFIYLFLLRQNLVM